MLVCLKERQPVKSSPDRFDNVYMIFFCPDKLCILLKMLRTVSDRQVVLRASHRDVKMV